MDLKLDKKGFTLVELLAVIVILAIVMLAATTAIGPALNKARKSGFQNDVVAILDAAKTAYQAEQLTSTAVMPTKVCFTPQKLKDLGYLDKGNNITGAVVHVDNSSGKPVFSIKAYNDNYMTVKKTGTTSYGTSLDFTDQPSETGSVVAKSGTISTTSTNCGSGFTAYSGS